MSKSLVDQINENAEGLSKALSNLEKLGIELEELELDLNANPISKSGRKVEPLGPPIQIFGCGDFDPFHELGYAWEEYTAELNIPKDTKKFGVVFGESVERDFRKYEHYAAQLYRIVD